MPASAVTASVGIAAGAAGAGLGAAALGYAVFAPRSGLLCPVVARGPRGSDRRVAITFDDGPWPGSTDRVLDALRAHGAAATFFVIGRYAREHPDLLRRIRREGHQIGNHTFDHHRTGLFRFTEYWTDQLRRTDEAVGEITGQTPRLFRPPMGFKSPHVAAAARRTGHRVVAWSVRGYDGVAATPERIAMRCARAAGGDIVLLHDGRDPASRRDVGATAAALPRILDGLRSRGLSAVTLDELIGTGTDRPLRA